MVAFVLMWPHAAWAQSAPPSAPPAGSDSWASWFKGVFTESDSAPDNTKASYTEWKAYFQNSACWGCTLFARMADITMTMGQKGTAAFAGAAASSVTAFMGLWVLFQLYKMLSVSHANSPAQSIDVIFNRLVLMMIIVWLLHNNPFTVIMQNIVLPSMGGIMQSATSMISAPSGGCSVSGGGGGGQAFVSQGIGLLCAMHHQMGSGLGLGAWLIDGASLSLWPGGKFELLRVIGGAIIFLAFGTMMVIMPFRFFDALVRIATVSAILPIVVLAYLFKPTRGVVKSAATSVLAAALTFLFTAIAIAIAVQLMETVVQPILNTNYDASTDTGVGIGPVTASDFMIILSAAVGMATMILQSGNLAAEFAGFQGQMGSAGNVGAALTGAAGGYAGRAVASAGWGGAVRGAGMAGRGAASGARAVASRMGGGAAAGATPPIGGAGF